MNKVVGEDVRLVTLEISRVRITVLILPYMWLETKQVSYM